MRTTWGANVWDEVAARLTPEPQPAEGHLREAVAALDTLHNQGFITDAMRAELLRQLVAAFAARELNNVLTSVFAWPATVDAPRRQQGLSMPGLLH